jgi:hypothetical protein
MANSDEELELNAEDDLLTGFLTDNGKDDRNPLWIWRAYQWVRSNELPVPEWIYRYFDNCAAAILQEASQPTSNPQIAIYEALGFTKTRGPGTFFTRLQTHFRQAGWALRVWELLGEGKTRAAATLQVAVEEKVHQQTVERAFKAFETQLQAELPHRR